MLQNVKAALRFWAKWAAETAQTCGYSSFIYQVGSRLFEYLCFARARRENGVLGVRDSKMIQLDGHGKPLLSQEKLSNDYGGAPQLKGCRFSLIDGVSRKDLKPSSSLDPLVRFYLQKHHCDIKYVFSACKTPLLDDPLGKRHLIRLLHFSCPLIVLDTGGGSVLVNF